MVKLVCQTAVIITISAVIGLLVNFVNPKGIPLIGEYSREARLKDLDTKKKELIKTSKDNNLKDAAEPSKQELELKSDIKLEDVYQIFNSGSAIFIDSRKVEDYKKGHIQGAINIYAEKIDDYKDVISDISKEIKIITYCGGTDCDLSILLADYLVEQGYLNVSIFFGGWIEWKDAGYPIEVSNGK
jgi:rhodanese-related sulfurtransferase